MLDHRNDCSLMALGDHCCLLIVTLALVGGDGACRRCISARARSRLKSQVVLLQTAHSWANAGVLLGARMHRERGSFRSN